MELYDQIFIRKSCRKYDMTPLPPGELEEIEAFSGELRPLLPEVKIRHCLLGPEAVGGLAAAKAPHYLVISGEPRPLRDTCAGFLYEQMALYLSGRGLGACWLGSARDRERTGGDDILLMCFGRTTEPHTRGPEGFKRKAMEEIARGEDPRLEAARLAPSAMNTQPWYFIVQKDRLHVYKVRAGGLRGMMYRFADLDVGIALSHLALAGERLDRPFKFAQLSDAPAPPKGYEYVGTV